MRAVAGKTVHQIDGAREQEIVVLPEAHLDAFDAPIRPAEIFRPGVGDQAHHGSLGMDVLGQARSAMIDLAAMRLTLR